MNTRFLKVTLKDSGTRIDIPNIETAKVIINAERKDGLSKGFDGVASAYAIQAGREVRVMVVPEKVDDVQAFKIAREIKNKIETELTYPGQIKVTVVRETRASEIAK